MRKSAPVSLASSQLGEQRHVCAFFDSEQEEYQVMFPFIREALERGERSVSIVPRARTHYLDRMRGAGIDVERARRNGQLELQISEDAYASEGALNIEAMLNRLEALFAEGKRRGYALTRINAHAEHTLIGEENCDSFLEYECRLTGVLQHHDDPTVCLYDLNRVTAGMAFDVLRTHPMTIMGGVLTSNPFFAPPEIFLAELRAKRERRAGQAPQP
jgi:hypothetical protein